MDEKTIRLAKALAALLIAVVILYMAFKTVYPGPNYLLSNLSNGKSENIYMELAVTPIQQMHGLMFRPRIIAILFIFNSSGKYPIHSNFVIAPFDALYLSENGTVVEMFRKIPPFTQRVSPVKDALYLLELPTGVTDSLSISVGDNLSWEKNATQ